MSRRTTDDSTEKSQREWPHGAGFALTLVGFIGWILLYGEYGVTLALWQLDLFGASPTDAMLMSTFLVMGFAPVFGLVVILFVRGDLYNGE